VGGHNPQFINHVGEERRPVAPFGGAASDRPLLTAASDESLSGGNQNNIVLLALPQWCNRLPGRLCAGAPELQEDAGQVIFTSVHAGDL
jgi:hypothetical protein